jgi:hypothetical protein
MDIEVKLKRKSTAQAESARNQESQAEVQPISFLSLFRFATCGEIVMIIVCGICSALIGVVLPVFAYLTGSMIDSF